jgi:hypothetical protein
MPTKFSPASTDPEEIKLITQLASNFGDRERYEKYIVWLDVKWPTCSKGPLGFAAQLNFSEITESQATSRFGLPQSGMLLVFAYSDADEGIEPGALAEVDGELKEIEGLTQVVYVREDRKLHRHEPEVKLNELNEVLPPFALQMVDALDLPRADDVTDKEEIIDAIDQIYKEDLLRYRINESNHWLMGYSVHSRTDNTSPGPDWMSLMTLDSRLVLVRRGASGYLHPSVFTDG